MKKSALIVSMTMLLSMASCSSNSSVTISGKTSGFPEGIEQSTVETSGKTTLKLAIADTPDSWIGWQRVWGEIDKFNRTSEDYYIDVTRYSSDEEDTFGDGAVQQMLLDFLTGNEPDLIAASPMQLDKFRKNGYLTDLSPLMESGVGLRRDELLDNVVESIDEGGSIQAIYPAFTIYTAAAKTELVGEEAENWTVQQAIDKYNSFPGDFLSYMMTEYDMRHYFFKGIMLNCIDFEDHTCDFNNGLGPVLDFLVGLPPMEKRFYAQESEIGHIQNDTALVKELWIAGISSNYANDILMDFGHDPFTYVGYPTDNGKGTITEAGAAFGIMENSENKSEAWEVLSQVIFSDSFLKDVSSSYYGVPVKKSVVDSLLEAEGESSVNAAVTLNDGSTDSLSAEQKQQFADFITSVEIDPFVNTLMETIIKEESDYVFEGERSVDECVDILQNRFELYLSETE